MSKSEGLKMRFRLMFVLGVLITLTGGNFAKAATYEPWGFSYERICFEDNAWKRWPTAQATALWDQSDAWLVNWDDCSSQPRNKTIKLKIYYEPTGGCAKTGSDTYTWQYAYTKEGVRKAQWHPDAMTIWMNMAPERKAGCYSTPAQLAHVLSHELGHAIGVGHNGDLDSVMCTTPASCGWKWQWPTNDDLANANGIY